MQLVKGNDEQGRTVHNLFRDGLPQLCPQNPGAVCGSWCPLFHMAEGAIMTQVSIGCSPTNILYAIEKLSPRDLTPKEITDIESEEVGPPTPTPGDDEEDYR